MHFSKFETLAPQESLVPSPQVDRLGLEQEPLYVAHGFDHRGELFLAVHPRSLRGGAMHTFIEQVAPSRANSWVRPATSGAFTFPDNARFDPYEDGSESHDTTMQQAHSIVGGHHTIGEAYTAFSNDARRTWVHVLADDSLDSVYWPLARLQAFKDFPAHANAVVNEWLEASQSTDRRTSASFAEVTGLLNTLTLPGMSQEANQRYIDRLSLIRKGSTYWADKRFIDEGPLWNYAPGDLAAYIEGLSLEEKTDLVGQFLAKSDWQKGTRTWPGANLLVDPGNELIFYHAREVYGGFDVGTIEETVYPYPELGFDADAQLRIEHEGIFATVAFTEDATATTGMDWLLTDYGHGDGDASMRGLHMAIAWRRMADGRREFLDYQQTQAAADMAELPLPGTTDNYLGRMMVRYYRQPGEQQADPSQKKWLTEMGLPGRRQRQPIRQREVPVWIALPQHQDDLLGSEFIEGVECSVAS